MGARAQAFVEAHRGAVARLTAWLAATVPLATPPA
jgi:hypothetical protein